MGSSFGVGILDRGERFRILPSAPRNSLPIELPGQEEDQDVRASLDHPPRGVLGGGNLGKRGKKGREEERELLNRNQLTGRSTSPPSLPSFLLFFLGKQPKHPSP